MKHIKKFLLIFSVLLPMIIPSAVNAEKNIYNIGILNDYEFSGNNISQYAKNSVQSVLNHIDNSDAEFSSGNLNDSINALNNGQLDVLCMVPQSSLLTAQLDYSAEPVAKGFLALFTLSEGDIYFEDFKKFNGMKIALLNNSYLEEYLKNYSSLHGFTYEPVYYNSTDDMVSAVQTQAADAVFAPTTGSPDGMRIIAKCGEFNYFFAVKKGNSKMLDKLNKALETLKQNHAFYLSETFANNFLIPYRNTVALTDDDYLAAKRQEEIRVLVPTDNYPMAYYDVDAKDYSGLYVEILKQIAQNTGLKIKYIPDDQPNMTLNSIEMGRSDIMLTVSGSTEGLVKATEPYTHIAYLPVARKDYVLSEASDLNIGILERDRWISDYLQNTHPQWTITEYSSINSLLRAVEHKKLSAALISTPDMQTKTSLIAHPKLAIVDKSAISVPVSLGVSALTCHYSVVNLLNKTIASVAVPQSEIENKVYTLSHIYIPNVWEMLYANKWWLFLALFIFAVIIVIVKLREIYFKRIALTDALTSIPNKRYFYETVQKTIDKSAPRPYLLCTLDARNFKLVNDRFGRLIGDQTLCSIAREIKGLFGDNSIYARAQSDSFLIFTEDTPESRERIESIASLSIYIHNSSNYHIHLKAGVCPIEQFDAKIGLDNYIDRAVIAKNHSPARNTNSVTYFTKEMENELNLQNSIEVEMDKALENGEFIVYYQPKYELKTDNIIGAEALVRWKKGDNIISPGLFIPLFEKNGFIVQLDFYIYEQVMKMLSSRIHNHEKIVPISMNVSRCHLRDLNFVERLEALVGKYQIPKQYIEMEITESIFSEADSSALALIRRLKDRGFTISMDDFGSGYSSLNLLREVPIDTLKIDKAFIDNAHNSPRGRVIVETIISMASKINIKTICEGVETSMQRDFLKNAGCNMVQGFLYSKPLPFTDFEKLLNSSN